MKKLFITFMLVAATTAAMAQETAPVQKHSVSTNSFWANWFVQANAVGTSFWGSQENQAIKFSKMTKDYRTNLGFSLALGKWFTPGIGLRTKFNGVWGRTVISEDKKTNASKYWTLNEQVLFNLSNMLMGYNEQRVWNFIPYAGAGIGRNMTYNTYGMGLTAGLLNTFRLSKKLAVNLDINYGIYEPGFDGVSKSGNTHHSLKNRDRLINVEVGLTYRLGKAHWNKTPDIDAIQALSQSEIDALNAQVADMMAENERLNAELAKQPKQVTEPTVTTVTKVVSAPVSVFFNLNKAVIASRKDLQNVADLVALAKQSGSKLVVTGYADSQTGNADYNKNLSQQRADAVAAELVKMGISRDQIETVAAGGVDTLSPTPYNRRATVEIK